ncbi:MAG: phosphotransferase [Deltaproteobacteria bacterium]|nr:phosphotransferase [Deltaproteobacteria bacterium]
MNSLTSQEKDFIKHSLNQENFAIEKLAGDVSTRQYFRITLPSLRVPFPSLRVKRSNPIAVAMRSPQFPKGNFAMTNHDIYSFILMKAEPNTLPPFIEAAHYLKKGGLSVPAIFKSHKALGLLLLEDGGNMLLESIAQKNLSTSLPFYKKALKELVLLQTKLTRSSKKFSAKNISFTEEKFLDELLYMKEELFKKYLKIKMNEKLMDQELKKLSKKITKIPYCLCHRDFHSRNILVYDKKIMILDFQDIRMGPFQYDVASLLRDSYISFKEKEEKKLLTFYFKTHKEEKSSFNPEEFLEHYDEVSLQRSLKACGTFAGVWGRTQSTYYLKYIPNALIWIRKVLSKKHKEYPYLYDIIKEIKL